MVSRERWGVNVLKQWCQERKSIEKVLWSHHIVVIRLTEKEACIPQSISKQVKLAGAIRYGGLQVCRNNGVRRGMGGRRENPIIESETNLMLHWHCVNDWPSRTWKTNLILHWHCVNDWHSLVMENQPYRPTALTLCLWLAFLDLETKVMLHWHRVNGWHFWPHNQPYIALHCIYDCKSWVWKANFIWHRHSIHDL